MTTFIKIIIDQNNQTLQLLQSQDFANAIESSVLALRWCRQLVMVNNDDDDHDDGAAAVAGTKRCLKECLDHSMVLLQDAPSSENNQYGVKSGGSISSGTSTTTYRYFVYKQGIEIPPTTTDLTMVTPVLVFNAAVALQLLLAPGISTTTTEQHNEEDDTTRMMTDDDDDDDDDGADRRGPTGASMTQKFLLKAKALYQLAHRQVDLKANTLFHFVAINNIAVIDQKLGNLRESRSCFCYLQARYLILMHQRKENRLSHLEGFWRNMTFSNRW